MGGNNRNAYALDTNNPECSYVFEILEEANSVIAETNLEKLLNQMLDLMIRVCSADSGIIFQVNKQSKKLISHGFRGDKLGESFILDNQNIVDDFVWDSIIKDSSLFIDAKNPKYKLLLESEAAKSGGIKNVLIVPVIHHGSPIGAVLFINIIFSNTALLAILANQLAAEIDKAIVIEQGKQNKDRLRSLVDILIQIGGTLDRDQLLSQIVESGRKLLNAEACSIFWSEEPGGDQFLHFASPPQPELTRIVQIPAKKGLIGEVVSTGKPLMVNDVKKDPRFFADIDNLSRFNTRTIIAVPLWKSPANIGQQQANSSKHVIGGLEALNKNHGDFQQEDVEILEMLAAEATTVLQLVGLHSNASEIFFDLIKALSSAIDAKDPYTEGHSQRVSASSIAIGKALGLSSAELIHLKIGSLLHDLGKIGVPDNILNKPGKLTIMEFEQMKKHTIVGEEILGNIRLLKNEIPALTQHHERLDGSGYPRGLAGDEISSMGKIVAVADVFDAMTSDRTYRKAMAAEGVLEYLSEGADILFDGNCVSALASEYQNGVILPAK